MNSAAKEIEALESGRPSRIPASPDEPRTLIDVFHTIARRHVRPDTLNFKRNGQWVSLSSAEMLDRVQRIAAGLYALGVRKGDRVALLSESRVEWTLADAGCIFAGAIDVPIYPTLTAAQVRYILKDSGSCALILARREKFLELKDVINDCPEVRQIILF